MINARPRRSMLKNFPGALSRQPAGSLATVRSSIRSSEGSVAARGRAQLLAHTAPCAHRLRPHIALAFCFFWCLE